jgi:ABC-type hemin transport system ATPase subunit
MLTVVMSSGDGKMRGVVKRNGSVKMTVAEMMSGAVKIKKESDRKNAAALRSAIAWMKIGARKRSGTLSI